ncbi:hypothetical protein [Kibdelosporangium philippinense]|uniref:hypothetical protein n=1 Tax=Kibdelosporangium philippinense TaxID=211113 RepID=UPI00360A895B
MSAAPAWRVERERRTAASNQAGGESSSLTRRAGGADTRKITPTNPAGPRSQPKGPGLSVSPGRKSQGFHCTVSRMHRPGACPPFRHGVSNCSTRFQRGRIAVVRRSRVQHTMTEPVDTRGRACTRVHM